MLRPTPQPIAFAVLALAWTACDSTQAIPLSDEPASVGAATDHAPAAGDRVGSGGRAYPFVSAALAAEEGEGEVEYVGPPAGTRCAIEYVGITATARLGNEGLPQMNADCEALYGDARVCRDVEVFRTIPAPVPGADAWVIAAITAGDASGYCYTPVGAQVRCTSPPNCVGSYGLFEDTLGSSMLLTADGNYSGAQGCAVSRVVACCAYSC